MKKNLSISGIIFSEDRKKVLLIKRRDVPVWVLPGGGIEDGETPSNAICREILEETGYEVKISKKVGTYFPINKLAKKTYLYECRILSGQSLTGDETKDIRFFSATDLPKHLPPPYDIWIYDAHQNYSYEIRKKLYSVNYLSLFKNLILHPILVIRFLLARLGIPINNKKKDHKIFIFKK